MLQLHLPIENMKVFNMSWNYRSEAEMKCTKVIIHNANHSLLIDNLQWMSYLLAT